MANLIEAVPNVSEGRRAEVLEALRDALRSCRGVALLHDHPDPDHNRTVLTAVGEPSALLAGLEELFARAVERIDLRRHDGIHPRVGAVDVCPFVPLPGHGTTMEDCVDLAGRLGRRVAERFDLPVFYYAEAARVPGRRNLTTIRRGQFEGLGEKLADPDWRPDEGPDRPHPTAGATVIGARGTLIAYNVVLDTEDVSVAKEIARQIRESSGGLPGIKAMGVILASRRLVQVSMNVERPEETPVHQVVEAIRRAAAERGVDVLETELVGLAPLGTVVDAAGHYLQLADLGEDRILETAVSRAFRDE